MDRRQLAAWLQEKLFERRIVLVTGVLDDALAAEVAAQLMTLDTTGDAPIEIHLDSPDGTLEAAFVVMDAIDAVRAPVRRAQTELLWRSHARLAQVTGRPAEEIAEDIRRGRHLDAQEALAYGLIDEITPTPR